MSDPVVTARFVWDAHVKTAVVVNPGGWFGKAWMLYVEDCFDPPFYVVEADWLGDAEDEFVDSEFGKSQRIEADSPEADDYGEELDGDARPGVFITLSGKEVSDPEKTKYLHSPSYTGRGTPYSSEAIRINGRGNAELPWHCTYHAAGLPEAGVSPLKFDEWEVADCEECSTRLYMRTDREYDRCPAHELAGPPEPDDAT